jgi:hypothetical protein
MRMSEHHLPTTNSLLGIDLLQEALRKSNELLVEIHNEGFGSIAPAYLFCGLSVEFFQKTMPSIAWARTKGDLSEA